MSDKYEVGMAEEEKRQFIVVKIGSEQYGLDISDVDNIVRLQKITRVPKSPAHYRGVINLRGEVVPVMSIRRKMGLDDDVFTNASRIIILKLEVQGAVGILVDEVKEVVSLGMDDIDRNVQNTNRENISFINGIGKNGNDLISLFDVNKIADEVDVA